MKYHLALFFGFITLLTVVLLSACQRQNNVCPPIQGTPQSKPSLENLMALSPPEPQFNSISVEIGGKMQIVDKLVDYPLCNDEWSGVVYT